VEELVHGRGEGNQLVLRKLREDAHAQALYATCVDDAKLGRMTWPEVLDVAVVGGCNLSPRFGIHQGPLSLAVLHVSASGAYVWRAGLRPDGTEKIRAIDDMSASSINAATAAAERLRCDSLDLLFEALRVASGSIEVRLILGLPP